MANTVEEVVSFELKCLLSCTNSDQMENKSISVVFYLLVSASSLISHLSILLSFSGLQSNSLNKQIQVIISG